MIDPRPTGGPAQSAAGQSMSPALEHAVTASNHAPTAGQTTQGGRPGHATNVVDPAVTESHVTCGNAPENTGLLATLLRPATHGGGRRMSKRSVGEIIKRG